MDSEHRHELEENVLAGWLAKQVEEIKPQIPTLLLIAFVALVAGIGLSYYNNSAEASRAEAWRDYNGAVQGYQPNLGALEEAVQSDNPDVMEWALITYADGRLFEAARLYLSNRGNSNIALEEAEEAYEGLLEAGNEEISDRAVYGLARVYELRGDLEESVKQYKKVRGPFAELARERAEQLELPRIKQDYAWIASTEGEAGDQPADRPGLEADDIDLPEDTDSVLDNIMSSLEEDLNEESTESTDSEESDSGDE